MASMATPYMILENGGILRITHESIVERTIITYYADAHAVLTSNVYMLEILQIQNTSHRITLEIDTILPEVATELYFKTTFHLFECWSQVRKVFNSQCLFCQINLKSLITSIYTTMGENQCAAMENNMLNGTIPKLCKHGCCYINCDLVHDVSLCIWKNDCYMSDAGKLQFTRQHSYTCIF